MKALLVDTNLLLRFLTDDVPSQVDKVERQFQGAEKGNFDLVILPFVVVEVIFQLEHWYKYSKSEACNKLLLLFAPEWMKVEGKAAVVEGLRVYKERNIDFVDLLLWSMAKTNGQGLLSFDKDFDKLEPKIRVEP